ncbi:MAG: radical SAM protein [Lachnospiraceae bacterium]|nr:radical SAM protein [Lachnospiraceae bacterium]
MEQCRLCGRRCGINRTIRAGRCGMTERVYAARAALHMWEEPCISGKEGSGAVFFTGCPLGCVFCQNREIALGRRSVSPWCRASASETSEDIESCDEILGVPVTEEQLAETFLDLENQRANNINLVTPTHFVPQIIRAVRIARERGLTVPILYNTGSYETEETVRSLEGTVDIFLPDLKFMDPDISARYAKAPDYFEVAAKAIRGMVEIAGPPTFDERGMMQRGVIVRHMVLPGYTKDSKRIIRHLHETYGEKIYVSIMNQYTPMPGIGDEFPELARRVTKREYGRVVDYALELGMENVFIQEGPTAEESFIPKFDGTGLII